MDGFERITGREHDGLVEKCQENGWLKVGGFDWQDDPFLEEYPYEFSRTDSVDRLRDVYSQDIIDKFCILISTLSARPAAFRFSAA